MIPGKYEVSYTERRHCHSFVYVSQEEINASGGDRFAAVKAALEADISSPHDVEILETEVNDILQDPELDPSLADEPPTTEEGD